MSIINAYATYAPPSASKEDMADWARALMASREPDVHIGENYLQRWWVIPRNDFCNIYLHRMLGSDDDRALHDHPWANRSFVLEGGYHEITPEGTTWRGAGDVVDRVPEQLHRLVLPEGQTATTLFMTGPKVRDWGFACEGGWVQWQKFGDQGGCGEFS